MKKRNRLTHNFLAFAFVLALFGVSARAQGPDLCAVTTAAPTYGDGQTRAQSCDPQGNLRTTASVSASIAPFAPVTTGTPIAVTTGGVTGTLPNGAVVVAFNVGTTNTAFCKLGASATVNDAAISPGGWLAFAVGVNTQLTCITSASTTTVNMVGGSGLPTGVGGGSSGGGGSVTQGTTPWVVSNAGTFAVQAAQSGTWNITNAGTFAVQATQAGTWTVTGAGGTFPVTGTFFQATQPVSAASGAIASGAVASGAVASGAYASGSIGSGAIASGAVASGAYASGSISAGAIAAGQPAQANWGQGATGAAPPSGATQFGTIQSGATGGFFKGIISCDNHVFKHITSATDTLAVQGVTSQTVYVCAWRSRAAGTATWFLENTASTNANCSSSNTQLTGVASEVANSGETWGGAFWGGLKNTAGNGLCINSTGTGGVDVDIWFTQF